MIVVDTNIISYLYFPTVFSNKIDALFKKDPKWAVPALWKSEFRNVVALYLRKGLINIQQALEIQEEAESLVSGLEFDIISSHVLTLVNQSSCSAYDCEFVSLAQQLDVRLITQDKKLIKDFPLTAFTIDAFLKQTS